VVVPVSFTVGLCVDFITRLSKLDKYSDKHTSRSLERIFVTGKQALHGRIVDGQSMIPNI